MWKLLKDEHGFTSLAVVVSLLISLALIFSTAQVYRVNSESANIQNVADASAQAAQSEVAEFMILVRVVDSVVLSLSLASIVSAAIGVVCMCIPFTAEAGSTLIEFSQKTIDARNKFADKSAAALNKLQVALPFVAAVKAYQVASANNGGVMNANYLAIAILQPGDGVKIEPGNIDKVSQTVSEIKNGSDELKNNAAEAENLARQAQSSKEAAWRADCGDHPNYCMAERAQNKAYMNGSNNPIYRSVDSWYFGAAILRARAYFQARLDTDTPTGPGVEKQADWQLRQHYYRFALRLMNRNYYYNNNDTIDMHFEHIPASNTEMQGTELFNNVYFPVTQNGGRPCMHAYSGCPNCWNVIGQANAQSWNSSDYEVCPSCRFTQSHFGSVASATSYSQSGFEYYYRIVEEQSKIYQEAKNRSVPVNNAVKGKASEWFNKLKSMIGEVASKRIYAKPPGSYGTISMVVNTSVSPASIGFESSFVSTDATLGVRAAVSASTMIEEKSSGAESVVSSILTGLSSKLPGVSGVGGVVLSAWSKLLFAYNKGSESISNATEKGLSAFSFNSASGLGTWAASSLRSLFRSVGLEPANLNALKPVLVNSWHVARAGANVSSSQSGESLTATSGKVSKTFATKFLTLRDNALKVQDATNSVLSGLANAEEIQSMLNLQATGDVNGVFEVATISPLGDWGPSVPIRITLPQATASGLANIVGGFTGTVRSVLGAGTGGKIWR